MTTFGEFVVDFERYEIRRGGEVIKLEPKVFDVLRYLIDHRDRVVTRDELLDRIWPDEHVIDAVVTRCIYELRKVFGRGKGEGSPIETVRGRGYRFTAEPERSRTESPPSSASPFVGRSRELERLRAAYEQARRDGPRLCLITGEPGIGKTRLTEELVATARQDGVPVWLGRGHEDAGAPPFWVWTQLMRFCVDEVGRQSLRESLGASSVELSAIVPDLVETEPAARVSPAEEAAHYRLFDAAARALREAAANGAHVLVIDDLHWVDLASLRMLGFVLFELDRCPLLLMCTHRDAEWGADDPRRPALDALRRHRGYEQLELGALLRADVDEYVAGALGEARPDLAAALHRTSEGNAFFMVEGLRPYVLDPRRPDRQVSLPEASRDIVRRRLSRLPQPTQDLLAVAAVMGRQPEPARLAQISGRAAPEVLEALQPALDLRILIPVDDSPAQLAFGHGLIRETIYRGLPLSRRVQLHGEVALWLERSHPEALSELAYHFHAALPAADPEKAMDWARRAAEAASAVYAHETAAAHYGQALDALKGMQLPNPARHHDLLLGLGRALRMAASFTEARAAFSEAERIARQAGDSVRQALAAIGMRDCQPLRAVPDAEVQQSLQRALSALDASEVGLRARVTSRLAAVRSVELRREMSRQAASLAADIDDPEVLHDVLSGQLHAAQGPDEIPSRLELADRLLALSREHDQPSWAFEALIARYDGLLRRGDIAGADEALTRCGELAEQLRHPWMQMEVDRHRTQRLLCDGRFEEAERGILRVSEAARRLNNPFGEFYFMAQMFWLLRAKGLLRSLGPEGDYFIERHPWVAATARASVGLLRIELGDDSGARECLEHYAREDFDNVPYGEDYVSVHAQLAQICAALDDCPHAQRLYDILLPYADQNVVNGPLLYLGSVSHFLGLLSAAMGNTERAREHLEAARAMNTRMGAKPALKLTEQALASL